MYYDAKPDWWDQIMSISSHTTSNAWPNKPLVGLAIQCLYMGQQSVVDMHTLLCTLIQICGIYIDASCTVSDKCMKSFLGNFWESGSVTWGWVLILIHYVSIPSLQVQEVQEHRSEHFSKPWLGNVHASSGSGGHHLLVAAPPYYSTLQIEYALLHQLSLSYAHRIFCRQTILRIWWSSLWGYPYLSLWAIDGAHWRLHDDFLVWLAI